MQNRLLLCAFLAVIFCAVLEAVVMRLLRKPYDLNEFWLNMANMALRTAVNVALPLSIATPLFAWVWEHRIATVPLDGFVAFGLLFVGQEFCYYWFHRASHRVRWFWASHSVHHTPNELSLAAALRQGSFGRLIGAGLFFVPLVWLGFSPTVVLASVALNLLYQFWIHATWIPRLGWLEHVLNTPSAHRVHHAANLPYLDANYGGVLVVFDKLFGTFVAERPDEPIRYGLVEPVRSRNPLKVEFAEWRKLALDLSKARSPRAFLGHLVMPPGWQPNGQGLTTEALRAQHRDGANLPA